jgi:hypothetical protein
MDRRSLRVGAVAPSGRALADLITAEITQDTAPVIELGPGTGVFTAALMQRGVPQDRLALMSMGPTSPTGFSSGIPPPRCSGWMLRGFRRSSCSAASAPERS